MEELAEAAGVSRRTLFNYFAGKADAVLGAKDELPAELLEVFRSGGPHRNLVKDLGVLGHAALSAKEVRREDIARYRRLLQSEPKLMVAAHQRLESISEMLVVEILEREGPTFDTQRARVAIRVLLALLEASLDAFVAEGESRELADLFMDNLTTAHELLS